MNNEKMNEPPYDIDNASIDGLKIACKGLIEQRDNLLTEVKKLRDYTRYEKNGIRVLEKLASNGGSITRFENPSTDELNRLTRIGDAVKCGNGEWIVYRGAKDDPNDS